MNLQRVKNPPIRLRDFASIDSMREEINEVVAFLQNPSAFREMGARPPRVCYTKDVIYLCLLYLISYLIFFCYKKTTISLHSIGKLKEGREILPRSTKFCIQFMI